MGKYFDQLSDDEQDYIVERFGQITDPKARVDYLNSIGVVPKDDGMPAISSDDVQNLGRVEAFGSGLNRAIAGAVDVIPKTARLAAKAVAAPAYEAVTGKPAPETNEDLNPTRTIFKDMGLVQRRGIRPNEQFWEGVGSDTGFGALSTLGLGAAGMAGLGARALSTGADTGIVPQVTKDAVKQGLKQIPVQTYEQLFSKLGISPKTWMPLLKETGALAATSAAGRGLESMSDNPDAKPILNLLGQMANPFMAGPLMVQGVKAGVNKFLPETVVNVADRVSKMVSPARAVYTTGKRAINSMLGGDSNLLPEDLNKYIVDTAKYVGGPYPEQMTEGKRIAEKFGLYNPTDARTSGFTGPEMAYAPTGLGKPGTELPLQLQKANTQELSGPRLQEELKRQNNNRQVVLERFNVDAPQAKEDPLQNVLSELTAQKDQISGMGKDIDAARENLRMQTPDINKLVLGESAGIKLRTKREAAMKTAEENLQQLGQSRFSVGIGDFSKDIAPEMQALQRSAATGGGEIPVKEDPFKILYYRLSGQNDKLPEKTLDFFAPEWRAKIAASRGKDAEPFDINELDLSQLSLQDLMETRMSMTRALAEYGDKLPSAQYRNYAKMMDKFDNYLSSKVQFPDNPDFTKNWEAWRTSYKQDVIDPFQHPAVKALMKDGKVDPEIAANKLWKAGNPTPAMEYAAAVNDSETVNQAALYSLNKALTNAKNPEVAWANWLKQHKENLDAFPDIRKQFDDPIKALDSISAQQAQFVDEETKLRDSVLARFIDKKYHTDPQKFGEYLLKDPGLSSEFFARADAGGPEMLQSARKLLWDAVKTEAGASSGNISARGYADLLANHEGVLKKHLGEKHYKDLLDIYGGLAMAEAAPAVSANFSKLDPSVIGATTSAVPGQQVPSVAKRLLNFARGTPFAASQFNSLMVDLTRNLGKADTARVFDQIVYNPSVMADLKDTVKLAAEKKITEQQRDFRILRRLAALGVAHGLGVQGDD